MLIVIKLFFFVLANSTQCIPDIKWILFFRACPTTDTKEIIVVYYLPDNKLARFKVIIVTVVAVNTAFIVEHFALILTPMSEGFLSITH